MCYKKKKGTTTQLVWVFLLFILLCYARLRKFISLLMEMCEWLEISWYGHNFETRPSQVIGSRVRWVDPGQPKKREHNFKPTHSAIHSLD